MPCVDGKLRKGLNNMETRDSGLNKNLERRDLESHLGGSSRSRWLYQENTHQDDGDQGFLARSKQLAKEYFRFSFNKKENQGTKERIVLWEEKKSEKMFFGLIPEQVNQLIKAKQE